MSRVTRVAPALIVALLVCSSAVTLAQSAGQEERIAASFVLALGRTPASSEAGAWAVMEPLSLVDLLARHRRQLQGDSAAEQTVIIKASQDAFGRAPSDAFPTSLAGGGTYAEMMRRHLDWLAGHPADYEQVVHRAYRVRLRRDAYAIEVEYWKRQPVLSFALLVGCVDDWARRNQPGLMATTGVAAVSVNSDYLTTVRLSPAVAAEARAAAGLSPQGDAAFATAAGRHLVAPGAGHITSVGGIHFTAAGAATLRSAVEKH